MSAPGGWRLAFAEHSSRSREHLLHRFRGPKGGVLVALLALLISAIATGPGGVSTGPPTSPHGVPVGPSALVVQKNITLLLGNPGDRPTGAFQARLVVDSLANASFINANWSNVEFVYPSGVPIEAWVESNASNRSTTTVVWLALDSILARSYQKVYLDIFSKLSFLLSPLGPTGEAPELSAKYAAFDNGAKVFTSLYDNFAGTNLSSNWVRSGGLAFSVHNGITLSGSNGGLRSNTSFGWGNETDWFGSVGRDPIAQSSNRMGFFAPGLGSALVFLSGGAYPDSIRFVAHEGPSRSVASLRSTVHGFFSPAVWSVLWNTHQNASWARNQTTLQTMSSISVPGNQSSMPVAIAAAGGTLRPYSLHWVRVVPMTETRWLALLARVDGSILTGAGAPVGGLGVSLARGCSSYPATASTCGVVQRTVTDPLGQFNFTNLSASVYLVWSNRTSNFNGADASVGPAGPDAKVALRVYPLTNLSQRVFVLPSWNNLSNFGSSANCDQTTISCQGGGSGFAGTQVPLLSWSQDGVFYVDASLRLVFFSFANNSTLTIAPWVPLYQNVMTYKGIENTEWVTEDSQYVYTFGRTSPNSTQVTAYWVNVTTGRHWTYTFTGFSSREVWLNAQAQMIGESGNYSMIAVIDATGVVHAYNFWNRTEFNITRLPTFEANNAYWVPELNSFVDVQANGLSGDHVYQIRLVGPTPGTRFSLVYSGTFASGYPVNGVDGVGYNVTSHVLSFTYASTNAFFRTVSYSVLPNGTLGTIVANFSAGLPSVPVAGNAIPFSVVSSEHRAGVQGWGAEYAQFFDLAFQNGSFASTSPLNGSAQWLGTNLTYAHPSQHRASGKWEQSIGIVSPAVVEGMFFNASFGLVNSYLDCETNGSRCGLNGNGQSATRPGTISYYWPSRSGPFPYPNTVSLAQTRAPSNVTLLTLVNTPGSATLTWQAPVTGANPVLNYTVFWGATNGSWTQSRSIPAFANSTVTIPGLVKGSTYFFLVRAQNFHGVNFGATISGIAMSPRAGSPSLPSDRASEPSPIDGAPAQTVGASPSCPPFLPGTSATADTICEGSILSVAAARPTGDTTHPRMHVTAGADPYLRAESIGYRGIPRLEARGIGKLLGAGPLERDHPPAGANLEDPLGSGGTDGHLC